MLERVQYGRASQLSEPRPSIHATWQGALKLQFQERLSALPGQLLLALPFSLQLRTYHHTSYTFFLQLFPFPLFYLHRDQAVVVLRLSTRPPSHHILSLHPPTAQPIPTTTLLLATHPIFPAKRAFLPRPHSNLHAGRHFRPVEKPQFTTPPSLGCTYRSFVLFTAQISAHRAPSRLDCKYKQSAIVPSTRRAVLIHRRHEVPSSL